MDVAAEINPSSIRVAVSPAHSVLNTFINRFSAGLSNGGYRVEEFSWKPLQLARAKVAIFHWPNEFFATTSRSAVLKTVAKLRLLRAAKSLGGMRLIWVAHNALPHDRQLSSPARTQQFLDAVDGIIYLSRHSADTIRSLYRLSPHTRELITVHGHYCDDQVTRSSDFGSPDGVVRLVYFGQIRPYKNVDELVACARQLDGRRIHLTVTGMQQDGALGARIRELARDSAHIQLDMRDTPLTETELETAIDSGHAVVLPYRQILNSGAALYALSRNRPVLAPRLGSLPELQSQVGAEWVYLFDGELTPAVLEEFSDWLRRTPRGARPNLAQFDWNVVSRATCQFIDQLLSRAMHPDPHFRPSE